MRSAPTRPGPGVAPGLQRRQQEDSADEGAPQILAPQVVRALGTLCPSGQRERKRCAQLRMQLDPRGHLFEVLALRAPLHNPSHPVRLVPSQQRPIPVEEISNEHAPPTSARSPSPPPPTVRPPCKSLRPPAAHGRLRPPQTASLTKSFQHNRLTRASSDEAPASVKIHLQPPRFTPVDEFCTERTNRLTRAASDEAPASVKIYLQPPKFTPVDDFGPERTHRLTRAASDEAPASIRIHRQPPSRFTLMDEFCQGVPRP